MDDGSKGQPQITAGLDLGDKYSYLCLIDTQRERRGDRGGSALRTTSEAFRRRFCCSEHQPLRIAIEAGTHSPWVSRVLEECSHEVRHGEKIASRGGKNAKKRAAVAVARKLSVLLHHLWVSGEFYEPLYNAHRRAQQQEAA